MSLRSKRLASPLSAAASAYLDSTHEDAALVRHDILGTLAHVAVLEKATILNATEAATLRQALAKVHKEAASFTLDPEFEDVHMNVESWLTKNVGDLGKKVHTGRSRNDQVALDMRLWARSTNLALAQAVHKLATTLTKVAAGKERMVLPGHTHFQIAQPVSLAHTLGAHAARLARDLHRLDEAYTRANVSPLGAGALAGTSHALDPSVSAQLLGFDRPFANSLDAVSDRDFLHDLLYAAALTLNHVSGLAEEFILFTHPAFGFATLDDAHATGSSLMPQKKNPDILEVARAKAATLAGALMASLTTTKALPLAYNRDLQEHKRLVLETLPHAISTVDVVADVIEGLTFHPDRMAAMAGAGYSDATELADYLVRKGVAFRDAHEVAAQGVQKALQKGVTLSELPLADFQRLHPKIGADVTKSLGPLTTMQAKTSPGGTSATSAKVALEAVKAQIETLSSWKERAKGLAAVEARLLRGTALVKAR